MFTINMRVSCRDSMGEKFWISCRVPGAKTIQDRISRPTGRVPTDGKFVIQDYKQVKTTACKKCVFQIIRYGIIGETRCPVLVSCPDPFISHAAIKESGNETSTVCT